MTCAGQHAAQLAVSADLQRLSVWPPVEPQIVNTVVAGRYPHYPYRALPMPCCWRALESLGEDVGVLAAAHDKAHAPALVQHDEQGRALLLAQLQRLQIVFRQSCACACHSAGLSMGALTLSALAPALCVRITIWGCLAIAEQTVQQDQTHNSTLAGSRHADVQRVPPCLRTIGL